MRRRSLHPDSETWPASPLKVILPEEYAATPAKDAGKAAAPPHGGLPPSASLLSMPASPLRFSPSLFVSPRVTKQSSPDRWLNHDLSSAPRLSPSHSRISSSLRDSWFDVEWRPPPGLEILTPAASLTVSSSDLVRSPGNRSSAVVPPDTALLKDTGSSLHIRKPSISTDNQLQTIKTPPPPSRAASAAAKRFFLSRHGKDCIDAFSRWRRHTLLNALQRRQSDDAVREWRRRNSRRMLILLKQGCVASKMDRLSAGKRAERICARSLARAAWAAIVAYSKASMLGFKLTNRISKLRCANAVQLLVRFQRLSSSLERMQDNAVVSYERRFFYFLRMNCEMASVLLHRADCFYQSVIARSMATILAQWKCISVFKSRIQGCFHLALRKWMLFAAAKMFSAWQSLTLISCSNRDTAIKWGLSCNRRRFMARWADVARHHRRIKTATAQIWMRIDSRTAMTFFASWKSIAVASLTAFKSFKTKWRLHLSSTVFECWCAAAGSMSALRLFVDGCNHHVCRRMLSNWRTALRNSARNLDRAARAGIHFLKMKCIKLWRVAALCKVQGRSALCNVFVEGWSMRVLVYFFSRFHSRVCEVKIESRISYYRCIAYQRAINAWKESIFDEKEAAGTTSPAKALRRSTALRLWAHQFPPKSPSKSLRSSQQFVQHSRSSRNQVMDFEHISAAIDQLSSKHLSRAFTRWLSVISEIQARRRVFTAAMNWHSSVYLHNILKNAFVTLISFAARSRTRLALKSKKCTQQFAFKQKLAVLKMWKHVSSELRHFNLRVSFIRKSIERGLLQSMFRYWMHWTQYSRVRSGYLRRVAGPCIADRASRRLLTCFRQAFGAWRQFLIPKRLSQKLARRSLLKAIGKMLIQWHHVALCTVDDRVADAIAGDNDIFIAVCIFLPVCAHDVKFCYNLLKRFHSFSSSSSVSRRKFSLLRCSIRAWADVADEIRNRPQLAEADMWFSRRLLRRVVASWDQERLLIRTKFAESSRRKDMLRLPASQSRLEAALDQEMRAQLQLNLTMQDALANPVIVAPVKAVIGIKQTPWRSHGDAVAAKTSQQENHRSVAASSKPSKMAPSNTSKAAGNDPIETPRALNTTATAVSSSNKMISQPSSSTLSSSAGIATPQSLLSSLRSRPPTLSKSDDVDLSHIPDQTIVPTFALINASGAQFITKCLEQLGWLRSKGDSALLLWVPHPRDIDFDRVLGGKLIVNQLRGSQYLCAPTGLFQTIGSAAAESLAMLHKLHTQWVQAAQHICASVTSIPSSSILYPQSVILSDFLSSAHSIPDSAGAWILKAAKPSPEFKYVVLDNSAAVVRRSQSQLRPSKATTSVNLLAATSAWRGGSDGSVGPGGAPIMPPDTLVQKYIQQPLLLGGRKFTITCYLLVLSVRPAFVLLNPGFIRRALNKYEPSDLSDEFGHSTNLKKMRQHPNFLALRDDCALSLSKLSPAFKGFKNAPILFDTEVLPKMRLSLTATLLQSSGELLQARGSFGFLSANFIIDSYLNPWLLSMDRAPDLEAYNAFQDAFLPSLVHETVTLVNSFLIEHARDDAACRSAVKLKMRNYAVLLDERDSKQ